MVILVIIYTHLDVIPLLTFFMSLISSPSVCLPGGEVPVSRRVPTEDHPRYSEDVLLHRQSYEDTTAAAGM